MPLIFFIKDFNWQSHYNIARKPKKVDFENNAAYMSLDLSLYRVNTFPHIYDFGIM